MKINTNVTSLAILDSLTQTSLQQEHSYRKLDSGLRITRAADDVSGVSIADKLRTQASSMVQGLHNGTNAVALIQIADKAMSEQSNILDSVKTRLIDGSTSTTNNDGREIIRKDIVKLLEQFDKLASQTNYAGTTLLQKSTTDNSKADKMEFQASVGSKIFIELEAKKASNTHSLGGGSDIIKSGVVGTNVDNNIDVASSKQVKLTGSIQLQTVDITKNGTETDSTSVDINVDVSGQIGNIRANKSDMILDLSSQAIHIKDSVSSIASNTSGFSYNTNSDKATLTLGNSVDLGDLNFSAMKITQDAQTANSSVSLNANSTTQTNLVISDNNTATLTPLLGQVNMLMENGDAKGGNTLENLKELKSGELTQDKANEFLKTIDEALTQINDNRTVFGYAQNNITSNTGNMETVRRSMKNAEGVIRDIDYFTESNNFYKRNILAQAGSYALSQANALPSSVQTLLK